MLTFVRSNHPKNRSLAGFSLTAAIVLSNMALSSVAAQQPLSPGLPFKRGEELIYQAEFKKGLLRGVDVAEFTYRADVERAPTDVWSNLPLIRLVGDVVTKGFFIGLVGYHFHEHVESSVTPSARFPMFDSNPFNVLHTGKIEERGKREWTSDAVFNHQTREVAWTIHEVNQTQTAQTTTIRFSEPIQDVLTVIYFLRTQRLEVGKSFDVPLTDSGRVFRLSVAVLERKKISTVIGRVDAFRIEPAIFGDSGLVRSRGQFSIWITDDDRHLPVKAQLKVDLGTFDIKLKRLSFPETRQAR